MNELHATISQQQTAHPEAAFIAAVDFNPQTSGQCFPNSTNMFLVIQEGAKPWTTLTQT